MAEFIAESAAIDVLATTRDGDRASSRTGSSGSGRPVQLPGSVSTKARRRRVAYSSFYTASSGVPLPELWRQFHLVGDLT